MPCGTARLEPGMLVVCDLEGRVRSGERYPSSETAMHLLVYKERPDAGAVVHAHPPMATAFAIRRTPLREPYLTETVSGLGEVPVAPFAMPSTQEVPPSSTLTATTVCSGTTVVAAWVSAVLACVAGEVASVAESGVAAVDVA